MRRKNTEHRGNPTSPCALPLPRRLSSTEICAGGELFDYLVEKGRLTEDEARAIFGQLCLAVAYVHEQGVVHWDLKLENGLLDERCRIKLGDFGFAANMNGAVCWTPTVERLGALVFGTFALCCHI